MAEVDGIGRKSRSRCPLNLLLLFPNLLLLLLNLNLLSLRQEVLIHLGLMLVRCRGFVST